MKARNVDVVTSVSAQTGTVKRSQDAASGVGSSKIAPEVENLKAQISQLKEELRKGDQILNKGSSWIREKTDIENYTKMELELREAREEFTALRERLKECAQGSRIQKVDVKSISGDAVGDNELFSLQKRIASLVQQRNLSLYRIFATWCHIRLQFRIFCSLGYVFGLQ